MSRDVPFDDEEVCDICGKVGAYDFMGDCLCPECMSKETERKEVCENEPDSYDLIRHLRKAEQEWYSNNDYDGAYWRVNIEVNELDGSFETTLKKIIDEGRR